MQERWWINGRAGRRIDVRDRGLHYADGLFETIAVQDGQPRFLAAHLDRLLEGCRRLALPAPDRDALDRELRKRAAAAPRAALKLILTRGSAERGYAPPPAGAPLRIIGLLPAAPLNPADYQRGVSVGLCATPVSVNARLAGLKTLARLEQVLAARERRAAGVQEGLMADDAGDLVCGTMSNLFLVSDGELYTPDLARGGIRGVMRRLILEEAAGLGIRIREAALPLAALRSAEEIFLSNALIGIWPVASLPDRALTPGPVTRRLLRRLAERGVRECTAGC